MFELVGPYNRVVIPYEEPAVYFLGAKDPFTGKETRDVAELDKLPKPEIFPLTSINDCIEFASTFNWDKEGFVACDGNFNRVKIKSPAYVKAHFARNNNVINRKHLINVIINNEVEEFLCYASDYTAEIEACKKLINTYHLLADLMINTCSKARSLNRGEYAALVKTFPRLFQDLLFKNYFSDTYAKEYTADWNENKWEEYILEMERLNNEYFEI
jgi:hypothetical protein